jgi:hypothetical protein
MKLIKFSIIALVLTFAGQFAKAQVQVGIGVNIGGYSRPVYRPYPVYETYPVYYERPVYRAYPRRVIYRPAYYGRPSNRQVYFRGPGRGHGYGHGHFRGHGRRW